MHLEVDDAMNAWGLSLRVINTHDGVSFALLLLALLLLLRLSNAFLFSMHHHLKSFLLLHDASQPSVATFNVVFVVAVH